MRFKSIRHFIAFKRMWHKGRLDFFVHAERDDAAFRLRAHRLQPFPASEALGKVHFVASSARSRRLQEARSCFEAKKHKKKVFL